MQPKYIQVMEQLREDIATKEPNTPIASEREIAQSLDISRMTVRRAIEELCREGVLYRDGNKGTFVSGKRVVVKQSPTTERRRILFLDSIYDSSNVPDVQKAFSLESHDRLFRMVRLILQEDIPIRIEEIYALPADVLDKDLDQLDQFFCLEEYRKNSNVSIWIKPILCPAKYMRLLHLKQNTPMICKEEQIRLKDGRMFLCISSYLNPDSAELRYETGPGHSEPVF